MKIIALDSIHFKIDANNSLVQSILMVIDSRLKLQNSEYYLLKPYIDNALHFEA